MDRDDFKNLVESWLEFQRTPRSHPDWDERRSVVDDFEDLCTETPEVAWAAILEIVRQESDEEILGVLAAGPLEDLLSRHGEALIDRVESESEQSPRFRQVLAGTWQLLMTDGVWRRVLVASGRCVDPKEKR